MAPANNDERIIQACRDGDREAFRLLFELHKDRVYSIALRFLRGDAASAEDVTQDVFVRLFTHIGQYRSEAEFTTWLSRMVVNACIDEQRRRSRFLPSDDLAHAEIGSDRPTPEQHLDRTETAREVADAVSDLSPDLRLTVLLKYAEGLSYDEMAAALGCSKGTVGSRLNRCHKYLARKLAHLRDARAAGDK